MKWRITVTWLDKEKGVEIIDTNGWAQQDQILFILFENEKPGKPGQRRMINLSQTADISIDKIEGGPQ